MCVDYPTLHDEMNVKFLLKVIEKTLLTYKRQLFFQYPLWFLNQINTR